MTRHYFAIGRDLLEVNHPTMPLPSAETGKLAIQPETSLQLWMHNRTTNNDVKGIPYVWDGLLGRLEQEGFSRDGATYLDTETYYHYEYPKMPASLEEHAQHALNIITSYAHEHNGREISKEEAEQPLPLPPARSSGETIHDLSNETSIFTKPPNQPL